jgi:hypothetical protein
MGKFTSQAETLHSPSFYQWLQAFENTGYK